MHYVRPAFAEHPTRFGRAQVRVSEKAMAASSSIAADIKLFATTFVGGFLFISILFG